MEGQGRLGEHPSAYNTDAYDCFRCAMPVASFAATVLGLSARTVGGKTPYGHKPVANLTLIQNLE